jgi:hypothetical protein
MLLGFMGFEPMTYGRAQVFGRGPMANAPTLACYKTHFKYIVKCICIVMWVEKGAGAKPQPMVFHLSI